MPAYFVRVSWANGGADTLHVTATDEATALAKGMELALAYSEATKRPLSGLVKPSVTVAP